MPALRVAAAAAIAHEKCDRSGRLDSRSCLCPVRVDSA